MMPSIINLIFITFFILCQFCSVERGGAKFKHNTIVFSMKVDDKPKIFSLCTDTKELKQLDIKVSDPVQYFIMNDKLVITSWSFNDKFYLFDPLTGETLLKSLLNNNPYEVFSILDCTSEKIIYRNEKDIYIDTHNDVSTIESISINAMRFGSVSCSNKNILAVLCDIDTISNGKNKKLVFPLFTFTPKDFLIIDLKSKQRTKLNYTPNILGNWSPNGKYLICIDSVNVRLLDYPTLEYHILTGFNENKMKFNNLLFLNDNTIVFQGLSSSDSKYEFYTFDVKADSILERIESIDSEKIIEDIYY